MKIEKISDTQIKFTLDQSYLEERGITTSDLVRGSAKTQELFREMMEKAMLKYDFRTETNTPLMVEAIPVGMESMTVIVTKVTGFDEDDVNDRKSLEPGAKTDRKFLQSPIDRNIRGGRRATRNQKVDSEIEWDAMLFYKFDSLDTVLQCLSFLEYDNLPSALYKHKLDYVLVIDPEDISKDDIEEIEMSICEFGNKMDAPGGYELYLEEHAEVIVKENAIEVLTSI